jgi:hypothetical protein
MDMNVLPHIHHAVRPGPEKLKIHYDKNSMVGNTGLTIARVSLSRLRAGITFVILLLLLLVSDGMQLIGYMLRKRIFLGALIALVSLLLAGSVLFL